MNYDEMSTSELRKLVRDKGLAAGLIVAGARKADLIALLKGDITELPNGSPNGASTSAAVSGGGGDSLADAIAAALGGRIKAGIDSDEVRAIVAAEIEDRFKQAQKGIEDFLKTLNRPNIVEVRNVDTGESRNVGVSHRNFSTLVELASVKGQGNHRLNIYLHGPAGTGKTTAASNLAKALGLPFYFNGAIDSEYKLSGFIDAQGVFRSRPFFEAYSKGGVYLFDELDSSLPGAVLAFNAALANGHADFPCGSVDRHTDCIILAAGNTTLRGDGSTAGYQRFEMDAAFRDRFVFLDWPIDEDLEAALVPSEFASWLETVRTARRNVERHGVKKVDVTPRATLAGVAMLANGIKLQIVIDATLRKGIPEAQWKLVSEGL